MTTLRRTENGDGRRQGAMRSSAQPQRPVRTRTVAIDESGPNPPAADDQ